MALKDQANEIEYIDESEKLNIFYVYEWFNVDTGEVFYVGKGKGNRHKNISGRNEYFKRYHDKYNCKVRKKYKNLTEEEAYSLEEKLIAEYKEKGQCFCNFHKGGLGGATNKNSSDETRLLRIVNSYINRSSQLRDRMYCKKIFPLSDAKERSLIFALKEYDISDASDFRLLSRDERLNICERVMEYMEDEEYNDFVCDLVEDGAYGSFDEYWEHNG